MKTTPLGTTGLNISRACLGTMTFGEQVKAAEAPALLDYAVGEGINILDTAELYAIPPKPETAGVTETIIGDWLKKSGKRNDLTIVSKVMGRDDHRTWLRKKPRTLRLTRDQIDEAVEGSLRRLQIDHIDIYMFHFPDRVVKGLSFTDKPDLNDDFVAFETQLESIQAHIDKGNIVHFAVSNETPWGVGRFCAEADKHGLPRPVCIENPLSLLVREFELELAETALREKIGLFAYSPLAEGVLTGKYLDGSRPQRARLTIEDAVARYEEPGIKEATQAYVNLARQLGLTPEALALKFVDSRPFVATTLIGCTDMDQLKRNIAAFATEWTEDIETAIEDIFKRFRPLKLQSSQKT